MSQTETIIDDGVIAGNYFNKYESGNPIVRFLMNRFHNALRELIETTDARDVHEVGCGEGYLARWLAEAGCTVRASDFSPRVIERARETTDLDHLDITYDLKSVYDLEDDDAAELVVCSEVLEHLDDPEPAVEALSRIARPYLLLSVPCEPIWRVLNVARGRYLRDLGNTPGHLQHWSHRGFVKMVNRYAEVIEARRVLPWTVVLARRVPPPRKPR